MFDHYSYEISQTTAMRAIIKSLKKHQDEIHIWTESLSHVAQILALLLAGFWAYKTFGESEKPVLEPHLTARADISWSELPNANDRCQGIVDLSLENIGKRAVDITAFTIDGWITEIPERRDSPSFIDDNDLKKVGTNFFHQTFTSGYLLGHFPPGVNAEDSFTWEFKNQPSKVAIWEITFTPREDTKYSAGAFVSDFVCNYSSNSDE